MANYLKSLSPDEAVFEFALTRMIVKHAPYGLCIDILDLEYGGFASMCLDHQSLQYLIEFLSKKLA